jgi:lysophospholipase L1-like esterase
MKVVVYLFVALLGVWMQLLTASACPRVGRLSDFNCNGSVDIVMLGDSLVSGVGDTKVEGGYVSRAQAKLPEAKLYNFGIPGQRALDLVQQLEKAFAGKRDRRLVKAIQKADVIFLDIGRNDKWMNVPALATYRNLKRVRSLIDEHVTAKTGHHPLIVTAVLMYPDRRVQEPWIRDLDDLIVRSNSSINPADLRFDAVSKHLLSADRIHPTATGYKAMAKILVDYLLTNYIKHSKILRRDRDKDRLFDEYEKEKFHTDPVDPDTDHDSVKDGVDAAPLDPLVY